MIPYSCSECGIIPCTMISSVSGEIYYFCSSRCKQTFFAETLPERKRKHEEEAKGILPQVRTFLARKTKEGITVVRRDGEVR